MFKSFLFRALVVSANHRIGPRVHCQAVMEALEPLRYFSVVVPTYTQQPLSNWPYYRGISGDLDVDGDSDLLAYSEGQLIGGLQQPDGSFSRYSAGENATGRDVAGLVDIDLDGDPDLLSFASLAIGQQPNQIIWQYNDGSGHFSNGGARLLPSYPAGFSSADLDRDGDFDLIILYTDAGPIRGTTLLFNDGSGNFGPPIILNGTGVDTGGSAAAADLDGDDDVDLAIPMQSYSDKNLAGSIRILRNDGRGGFAQTEDVIVGDNFTVGISAADVDDDGDVDLVTDRYLSAAHSSNPVCEVVLLLNDGTGHFPTRQESAGAAYPWPNFIFSDLNSDSMPDVVDAFNNLVFWNDGTGKLLPVDRLLGDPSASVGEAIDLNNDGRSDMLSGPKIWLAGGFTDTLRPVASRPDFIYNPQAGSPALRVDFSENVRRTLRASDFQLVNLTTGQPVTTADFKLNYSAGDIVSLLLPASLPDGNYRLKIASAAVADIAGNTLASDFQYDFAVLAGDANRDRKVDAADLGVLAINWQGSSKTFSQGDFNYDGIVDIKDLAIFASKWQQTLPPPPPAVSPISLQPAPAKRAPARMVSLVQ